MTFKKGEDRENWKARRSYLGVNNPNYGRHHSDETKELISKANTKLMIEKEELCRLYNDEKLTTRKIGELFGVDAETVRLKLKSFEIKRREPSQNNLGKKFSKEHKEKIGKTRILLGLSKGDKNPMSNPETVKKYFKSISRGPTSPERKLMKLIKKCNLPFRYNGNKADLIIGRKVPDFYEGNGKKRVIEVFGEVFHDPNKSYFKVPFKRTEEGTIKHYSQYGFDTLIIWEKEFKDLDQVAEKIIEFDRR